MNHESVLVQLRSLSFEEAPVKCTRILMATRSLGRHRKPPQCLRPLFCKVIVSQEKNSGNSAHCQVAPAGTATSRPLAMGWRLQPAVPRCTRGGGAAARAIGLSEP